MKDKHAGMTKQIIEALLFVSEKPVTIEDLRIALDGPDDESMLKAIEELKNDYQSSGRSFTVGELAGGYQIITNPEFAPWINKLFKREETRLSGPSLETLAIIAYKQPLTRGEIEKIRGVSVEGVLKTLLDKNLIKIRGRKDAPGRPIAYGTTEEFLKRFGLKGLEHLPKLRDFSEHDLDFGSEERVEENIEPIAQGRESTAQNKGDDNNESVETTPQD